MRDFFKVKSKDWINGCVDNYGEGQLRPHEDYLSVKVIAMNLSFDAIGFRKFHSAVNCFFSYQNEWEEKEVHKLIAPSKLSQLDKNNLGNVIQLGETILKPVPYYGGEVKMELGLFAVECDDIGDSFLKFVGEVSSLPGTGVIQESKPILNAVKNGIDLLLGSTKAKSLEVGISRTISEKTSGRYAAIKMDSERANIADFQFDENSGQLLLKGSVIKDIDYIVYQIDANNKPSSMFNTPELQEPWSYFREKVLGRNQDQAKDALIALRFACLTSTGLFLKDREALFDHAEKLFNSAYTGGLKSRKKSDSLIEIPELSEVQL